MSRPSLIRSPLLHTAAAFLLAALALALAMPGIGWWPFLLIFAWALAAASTRSVGWRTMAALAWLGGTVHWMLSINWVLPVMRDYGSLPLPVATIALVVAGLICGVFWVPVALIVRATPPTWQPLALPAAWAAAEAWRQFPPLCFPWNPTAAAFIDQPWAMAGLPVWGATGLAWALLSISMVVWRWPGRAAKIARLQAGIAVVLAIAAALTPSMVELRPGPRVAVLQPATLLEERWNPGDWAQTASRIYRLSAVARSNAAELILWPEGAVPFRWDRDPAFRADVREAAGEATIILNSIGEGDGGVLNAAISSRDGASYAKVRLVPFGEYVPFWGKPFLSESLVREVANFVPGSAVHGIDTEVGRLGMAICYEVVFAEHAAAASRDGAEILITLTNDGWYGTSRAPAQHLAQARLRSAETGRAMARAALTGISALIGPDGELISSLDLGERDLLVGDLPLASGLSVRTRLGDWWALICVLGVTLALLSGRRSR